MEAITTSTALTIAISIIGAMATLITALTVKAFNKILNRLDNMEDRMDFFTRINTLIVSHLSEDEKFTKDLELFFSQAKAAKT